MTIDRTTVLPPVTTKRPAGVSDDLWNIITALIWSVNSLSGKLNPNDAAILRGQLVRLGLDKRAMDEETPSYNFDAHLL